MDASHVATGGGGCQNWTGLRLSCSQSADRPWSGDGVHYMISTTPYRAGPTSGIPSKTVNYDQTVTPITVQQIKHS